MNYTVRGQELQLADTIKEDYAEQMIDSFYVSVAKEDPEYNNYLCFSPTRIFYYKIKEYRPKLKWQMDWIDFDELKIEQGTDHNTWFMLMVGDKKVRVDKKRYTYPRLRNDLKPAISAMIQVFLGNDKVTIKRASPEVVTEEISIPIVYVNKGGALIINNIQDSIVNRSFTD